MKLIVGLGNPGFKYKKTRHNAGFLAVDYIQKNISGFPKWKSNKIFTAEMARNNDLNIVLSKPQIYMNNSGKAVKTIIENLKLKIENLIVIHDDFDLPLGEFKIEQERGSAGHKGVQSIIDALGANDFWRLRIGIRPANIPDQAKAEDFVLKKFVRGEKIIIDKIIPEAVKTLFETIAA